MESMRRGLEERGAHMSVKLKVSYERPEELRRLLDRLGPEVKSWRHSQNQDGRFMKAYIFLNEPRTNKSSKMS